MGDIEVIHGQVVFLSFLITFNRQISCYFIIKILNKIDGESQGQMHDGSSQRVWKGCSGVNQVLFDPNDLFIIDFLIIALFFWALLIASLLSKIRLLVEDGIYSLLLWLKVCHLKLFVGVRLSGCQHLSRAFKSWTSYILILWSCGARKKWESVGWWCSKPAKCARVACSVRWFGWKQQK